MSDSDKALGQAVEQKPADKLNGVDRLVIGSVVLAILGCEGDGAVFKGQQSAVGNSHSVGVSSQVLEHTLGVLDRITHTDHPGFIIQTLFELRVAAGKMEFSTLKGTTGKLHELSAKDP